MGDGIGSFNRFSDDIILIILSEIEAARDLAHLGQTCRRLHQIVSDVGWRLFAQKRFPSSILSSAAPLGWQKISESLTFQSRCWDRRSLRFKAILRRRGQFMNPTIGVHHDLASGEELVVWGAHPDILGRYRSRASATTTPAALRRVEGRSLGFESGFGDVVSVCIVESPLGRRGELGMVVGRADGHLSLLSAQRDSFGQLLSVFSPPPSGIGGTPQGLPRDLIYGLDVSARAGMLAAATPVGILLYNIPQDEACEVQPAATVDDATMGRHSLKWMADGDLLAVALRTDTADPIRLLQMTPAGPRLTAVAKNAQMAERLGPMPRPSWPQCIQPLGSSSAAGGESRLLLSAWSFGGCVLQDVRTPSPWDQMYMDKVAPFERHGSLLPFGTERFVAGSLEQPAVKIFDFRWPRAYYYTAELPCSDALPFPPPAKPFSAAPRCAPFPPGLSRHPRCHERLGYLCPWHSLGKEFFYLPNCNIYLRQSMPHNGPAYLPRLAPVASHSLARSMLGPGRMHRICSLARGSDLSPNFYIGVCDGIIEAYLQPGDDNHHLGDPNFGLPNANDTAALAALEYDAVSLSPPMLETGDGLAVPPYDRSIFLPPLVNKHDTISAELRQISPELRNRHRLDISYQEASDYEPTGRPQRGSSAFYEI